MALETVAWMVDKARHSADLGRMLASSATGGRTGITEAGDFKVTAQTTPDGNVRVAPGGATLKNLYPNVINQSYMIRNISETLVSIPATTTAAVTRWVIARISDPQFGGAAPADVLTGPYVFLEQVTSITGLNYPHIVLARIAQPANTAAITNDMITDLRKLTNPRIFRKLLTIYPTGVRTTGHVIPTAGYSSWPITAEQRPSIEVPEWANRLDVVGQFSGLWYTSANADDTVAGIRSGFGATPAENGIMIENRGGGRGHYTVVGSHPVTQEQRGTNQLLNLQGVRSSGTGLWYADYQSSIAIDYQFTEVPV